MIKLPIQSVGLGMFMFQSQSDRLLFARQEAATQLLLCYLLSIIGDKARTLFGQLMRPQDYKFTWES